MSESGDKVVGALEALAREIRQPAEGVVGMTSLLLDTELSDEQRDYTLTIRQSTDRLLTIINDIIDYARIDAGTLQLEHVDFDLRVMLAGILEGLLERARDKGLELVSVIEPDVPSLVLGDPGRLRQVLLILVDNAIKFTSRGRVDLAVRAAAVSPAHATVRIEITDSGAGLTAEQQQRLFSREAPAAGPQGHGGTGLGLSIAARLTEMMGGQIGVSSAPGQGATFWFSALLERRPAAAPDPAGQTDLGDQRVLLVSESASARAVVSRQLDSWGCSYAEAASDRECLDELRQAVGRGEPYDIVVIDPTGRGLDGEALGRAIKQELAIAGTALMLLATAGQRGDAARLRGIGFDAFLTKPVEASQVRDGLVTLAARRGVQDRVYSGIITRHSLAEERKRKVRILLVEENHINQKVAVKILQRLGYPVDAVASGREALANLSSGPYDVVLLDQSLSDLPGEEVAQVIRDPASSVLDHNIPVVALVDQADEQTRSRCQAVGMDDLVAKPVHPGLLQEAIERQLPQEPQSAAAGDAGAGSSLVFDRKRLLERLGGDELLCEEVLDEFLGASPALVESLRAALGQGDLAQLRRQACTLRGAAANVSAEAIRGLSHKIEAAAREGLTGQVLRLVERIERELERLRRALR